MQTHPLHPQTKHCAQPLKRHLHCDASHRPDQMNCLSFAALPVWLAGHSMPGLPNDPAPEFLTAGMQCLCGRCVRERLSQDKSHKGQALTRASSTVATPLSGKASFTSAQYR